MILIHASCVAIDGRAVLLAGGSGSGKSDLALRLIDRGAALVSDDYTQVRGAGDRLYASAPSTIAGKIEMRGVGIVEMTARGEAPVCLHLDLESMPERLPDPQTVDLDGLSLPSLALRALEASAPLKVERALLLHGLLLA
jgi:serine kinase of HPr protein (carbohydrate metabolism regulator)